MNNNYEKIQQKAIELGYDPDQTVYRLTLDDILCVIADCDLYPPESITKELLDKAIEAVGGMDFSPIAETMGDILGDL